MNFAYSLILQYSWVALLCFCCPLYSIELVVYVLPQVYRIYSRRRRILMTTTATGNCDLHRAFLMRAPVPHLAYSRILSRVMFLCLAQLMGRNSCCL